MFFGGIEALSCHSGDRAVRTEEKVMQDTDDGFVLIRLRANYTFTLEIIEQ